jgi:hypothetical protein
LPTAIHSPADEQDTPKSAAESGSTGVCWIDHRFPFQRSATVPDTSFIAPTATHHVVDTHETPLRELELAPGGFGLR